MMGSETEKLKIFFLPFVTPGHMIPMVDEARVFAKHGVDVTIIVTKANAGLFQKTIDRDFNSGLRIRTHVLQFPSARVGLPDGIENFSAITSLEMAGSLIHGMQLLQNPIEILIDETRPDCIVADMFFPWSLEVATKLGIPRIAFRGTSHFSLCAEHCVRVHKPHESAENDAVLLPGFPDKIEMLISQLPEWSRTRTDFSRMMDVMRESEEISYGMLMNSFQELESNYEEYFKSTMSLKAWSVGPVSLWANQDVSDKAERFDIAGGVFGEVVEWLNSKEDGSVIYVNFGSLTKFSATQLREIAHGLEASGCPFVWVARKKEKDSNYEQVLPEGFEERMRESERGFIIKDWAPQMLILDHPATGGMVTHCGWNSILEGVNAGLPMITWPLFAEQFYNEKLLTHVLRIGVAVRVREWRNYGQEDTMVTKREDIDKAVRALMGDGEEAIEMRKRVKKLRDEANRAVEVGGSSHANLMALIHEIYSIKINREGSVT